MKTIYHAVGLLVLVRSSLAGPTDVVIPPFDINPPIYAKSIVIVRIGNEAQDNTRLTVSKKDEQGHDSELILNPTRPRSAEIKVQEAFELLVPLVGHFDSENPSFVFPKEGTFTFVLKATVAGSPANVESKTIKVERPLPADLAFLEAVASRQIYSMLIGNVADKDLDQKAQEWIMSEGAADFRALSAIRELLIATQANEPGDLAGPRNRSVEEVLGLANVFEKLARDYVDASYAAYANYFAGCGYLLAMAKENKTTRGSLRSAEAKGGILYEKATIAFRLSAANADIYLKPQVLYMKSLLHAWADELEAANRTLEEAALTAHAKGPIASRIALLRDDLQEEAEKRRNP